MTANTYMPKVYNVVGPITVLLEPGMPVNEELSKMWEGLRQKDDDYLSWHYGCVDRLVSMYKKLGFDFTEPQALSRCMGRVVQTVHRHPGDRLMMPPNPLPLASTGRTPRSTHTPSPPKTVPKHATAQPDTPTPAPKSGQGQGVGKLAQLTTPKQGSGPVEGQQGQQDDDSDADMEEDDIYGVSS